jgi:23S rRNA pseudouridine1911/1915/1917 synthase
MHTVSKNEVAGDYIDAPMNPVADDDDPEGSPVVRFVVSAAHRGERLDKALAQLLPQYSRSRLQQWIEEGAVALNGAVARVRTALVEGDLLEVRTSLAPDALAYTPEPMHLDIVHQDESIIVINKPPGLVVHPGAGNWSGTLLNGLLAHDEALALVPRAGIVHRLDADTSGLMVVARTLQAHTDLVRQLQARSVLREYWAIVLGAAPLTALIDSHLARDPRNPLRFKVSRAPNAREARTLIRRIECVTVGNFQLSWIACRLQTGRTHQIRAHLESIGHPLVGDPVYRRGRPSNAGTVSAPCLAFSRQALHACRLALIHPLSGTAMTWFRPPPDDMAE